MEQVAILEAEAGLSDPRRGAGQRHTQPLCLALFTLAVAAGNWQSLHRSAQGQPVRFVRGSAREFYPTWECQRYLQRAWSDWKTYCQHLLYAWWYPRMAGFEDADSSRLRASGFEGSSDSSQHRNSVLHLIVKWQCPRVGTTDLGLLGSREPRPLCSGSYSKERTKVEFARHLWYKCLPWRGILPWTCTARVGLRTWLKRIGYVLLVWRNLRQYLEWLNHAPIEVHSHKFQTVGRFLPQTAHKSEVAIISSQEWLAGGKQLPFSF